MRTDILEFLRKEIYIRCSQPENVFGIRIFQHFDDVARISEMLSNRYGGDTEVVVFSAWLHDIASITDKSMIANHHIIGAQIATNILKSFNYDTDKITHIAACIQHHRGSIPIEKATIEEIIIADADAAAHFYDVPSLLHMAYNTKGLNVDQGAEFVRNKLTRSWNKLSIQSKEIFKDIYNCDMAALSRIPENFEEVMS